MTKIILLAVSIVLVAATLSGAPPASKSTAAKKTDRLKVKRDWAAAARMIRKDIERNNKDNAEYVMVERWWMDRVLDHLEND